jgi:hypothetical protein
MTYVTVEAEIDLSEIDTEDLVEELESRNAYENKTESELYRSLLTIIWQKRRLGDVSYDKELDTLIYDVLGHVI